MPVVRFTLTNTATGITQQWPMNPLEGVVPKRSKKVDAQTSSSPSGQPLLFEGRENPRRYPFKGNIRNKAHHDFLIAWYDWKVPAIIRDELDNTFTVYLVDLNITRRNRHNNPWSGTYEAEAIVIA